MQSRRATCPILSGLLFLILSSVIAASASNDGIARVPASSAVAGTTVTFPMSSATSDTSWAVPIYDVEFINPADGGAPIKVDGIAFTLTGSLAGQLGGIKVTLSGARFTGTDSVITDANSDIVTSFTPADPFDIDLGVGDGAATGDSQADVFSIADGDTVRLTLYAYATSVTDGATMTVQIGADADIVVDASGADFATRSVDGSANATTVTAYPAATVATTDGDPGALGLAVNVPSIATSRAVAVPVFQFKIIDTEAGSVPVARPTLIDGFTIPITLAGGMDPEDIAGASLEITSSTPDNTVSFNSVTAGGANDRELNTADDPGAIALVTTGGNVELRVGTDAGIADSGAGTGDLVEIPDPGTADTDYSVVFTVRIWLATSGLTANSTASFSLDDSDITLSGTAGTQTDAVNPNARVRESVATLVLASNENTTLSDRSTVGNASTLSSSATSASTAAPVFDFFVADGIGGTSTKIDSLAIPVTLSGGAKFGDLAGAKLTVSNGAGITLAGVGNASINSETNPTLVHLDSLSPTQALLTFKGRAVIDTTDATADLIEIPDGGSAVAFEVAVWVDTSDIAYGSTLSFDMSNDYVTLTGRESDGLAAGQEVTRTVAGLAVGRLAGGATTAADTAVVLSSAAIARSSGGHTYDNAVAVFDFEIVDPHDGADLRIDGIRIPLTFSGGADVADLGGVEAVVSGLSDNTWIGPSSARMVTGTDSEISIDSGTGVLEMGEFAAPTVGTPLLVVPDGETATITLSCWVDPTSLVDSSTVTFSLDRSGILLEGSSPTTALAASQEVSGLALIRATTLGNAASVPDSTYLSAVNTSSHPVTVFGFTITDPADGYPTRLDQITLTASGTGNDADITHVAVSVSGGGGPTFASGADDGAGGGATAGDNILETGESGLVDTGTFPANGQSITMGAAADGDGTADLIEIADGTTATFMVTVYHSGAPAGSQITLDLTSADVAVDGGDAPSEIGSAIAAGQDLSDKIITVTSATTLLADLSTVPDAVTLPSTATTEDGAVAVFDFTVSDASGGAATNLDALTIPVICSGVDSADVAGVVVTTTGTLAGTSDSDGDGSLTLADDGLALQRTTDGIEILLGGAAAGVTTTSNGAAELIQVSDGASANVTVSVYLSSAAGALTDGGTMTFTVGSANFVTDGTTSDAVIPAQSVTPGVATVGVEATALSFTGPSSTTLAAEGVSDTIRVAATDVHGNVDTGYLDNIQVSTSTTSGQFSLDGTTFSAGSLSTTPEAGSIAFYYRDSATGSPRLTATSGSLSSATLDLTVEDFAASVAWGGALAVADTTDSAGTSYRIPFTVTTNDPNLLVEFWVSQQSDLTAVLSGTAFPMNVYNPDTTSVLGRMRNPGGVYATGPGIHKDPATDVPYDAGAQSVLTSDLATGVWYIYMARADGDGVSSGGSVLGHSGPLYVRHYPHVVAFGVTEEEDGIIDEQTTFQLDSGGTSPSPSIDLLLYAEDDDSNDDVRLYISTNPSLTSGTVLTDSSSTHELASTANWKTNDVADTLRYTTVTISDSLGSSPYYPRGTYYLYALITDAVDSTVTAFAQATTLDGEAQKLVVNHSPMLTFSQPADTVRSYSLADHPEFTVAWNGTAPAGDQDIDDDASISLWFAPADSTPTAADTTESWMKPIVRGLEEDPDGGANDQYAWDLTRFDGQFPTGYIRVWAVLDDGGGTPVLVSTYPIQFTFAPSLTLLNPPPGGITEIRENETYRFLFDADYASATETDATVRFFISAYDTTSMEAVPAGLFTFDTGASSTYPGNYNAFWISGADSLHEGEDTSFDWTPRSDGNNYAAEIVPQTSTTTTFYVYAVMNTTGNAIDRPDNLLLARAPGRVRIGGLGTTITDPAVSASPNQGQVAAGDTLRVLLRGSTNNTAVQWMQLFVNVDSTQFALVDQDSTTPGVQPFGFSPSYFFGSVTALINRVTLSGTTYKLDLDKRNLSAPADPTGQILAYIDLVARSFTGSASVYWSDDRVNDPNRIPLFYNADGILGLAFVNPLATFTSVNRGSISGFVPLQGDERTTDSKVTTFWLREPGSWISISDTAFVHANDDSTSLEGVQLTTGSDGSFTLTQVPAGTYELVAKSESYLAGYAPVSVVNGQAVTGLIPTRVAADDDPGELLGGDVTGDNKIDADDESAFNLAYEASTGDSNFNSAADIDDDGSVLMSDLLILAANMRSPMLTGVEPVYKPAGESTLVLDQVPPVVQAGDVFDVDVRLAGTTVLTAYSVDLLFDPQQVRVLSVDTPALTGPQAVRVGRQVRPGRYALAQAVRGGRDVLTTGDVPLATVRLAAITAGRPHLKLAGGRLARAGHGVEILDLRTLMARPQRFHLWPNSPNPFNPETHIAFDLPEDGVPVALTVFNAMGQPVRTLVRQRAMNAGRYEYTWDGRDESGRPVGSGVYLCRLHAGRFEQMRKMLLVK